MLSNSEPPEETEIFDDIHSPQFERFELDVASPIIPARLPRGWPRQMRGLSQNGVLEGVAEPTKVRVHLVDENGAPIAGRRFMVLAQHGDEDPTATAEGITDGQGYGAATVVRTGWRDLAVVLPDAGDGSIPPIPIGAQQRVTNGPLGLPHTIRLPRARANALPRVVTAADTAVVHDPDADDVRNSPDSFGLNEEHVDGSCCLRPQQQFPTREYLFRQIVRFAEPELISISVKQRFLRKPIQGPVNFESETSAYDVMAATPVLGAVNLYRQGWFGVGRGLGELLYSMALAPCEQVTLAFVDWSRTERDTRDDRTESAEKLLHRLNHDRTIDEAVDGVIEEEQSGDSATTIAGAGGFGPMLSAFGIGGGTSASSTEAEREIHVDTVQEISDAVVQRSSALRSQRSTVVTTSRQTESEQIQTRTVRNHNRNHAMTIQYFQVISQYLVKTELVEQKPVLLIPYGIDNAIFDTLPALSVFQSAPNQPIARFLDRHRTILEQLVPARLRPAFASISRLLHARDLYPVETPFATASRWTLSMDQAWRAGIQISVETTDGQSVPLRPRNTQQEFETDFESDPVRVADIASVRVAFDSQKALEALLDRGISDVFGHFLAENSDDFRQFHLQRLDLSFRTDRSRFLPDPMNFRVAVQQRNVRLRVQNPFTVLQATAPTISFAKYRGQEHEDYARLRELVAHIQARPMQFLRAIWLSEDPDRRAIRFDKREVDGEPLLNLIFNKPVGIVGNMVAFPLLEPYKRFKPGQPQPALSERVVSLPTKGVFAEVFLSCCNATEKRDVERMVDPEQACGDQAPVISGITPQSRRDRADTTPTPLAPSIINIQTPPGVPDPTGLAGALQVLGTPDIFRDLSRGAELLQAVNSVTGGALANSRFMAELVAKTVAAIATGGVSAIAGGGGSAGNAGAAGVVGNTQSGSGGGGPSLHPGSSPGSSSVQSTPNPALGVANAQLLRQTPPQRIADHLQTIQNAVDSGVLTAAGGQQAAEALLTGGLGPEVITAGFPSGGAAAPDLARPTSRACCAFGDRLNPAGLVADNIVEQGDLSDHSYAFGLVQLSEKNGLIYSCLGGFLDTAHIRDLADMTGFLAAQAKFHLSSGGTIDLNNDHGIIRVVFKPLGAVPSDDLAIAVAQSLAYELSVWHEVATWFDLGGLFPQRLSAFSPEDNYSNLLGTYIGAAAIKQTAKSFDAGVVDALLGSILARGARPKVDTLTALNKVHGLWWDRAGQNSNPIDPRYVRRRHLDAFGMVKPWVVTDPALPCPVPAITMDLPVITAFDGRPITDFASIEISMDAGMQGTGVAGVKIVVTGADLPACVATVRADVIATLGVGADGPD